MINPPSEMAPTRVCSFFLQGKCTKGASCPYAHTGGTQWTEGEFPQNFLSDHTQQSMEFSFGGLPPVSVTSWNIMMRGAQRGAGPSMHSTTPWNMRESAVGYERRTRHIFHVIGRMLDSKTDVLLLQECDFARDADKTLLDAFVHMCRTCGYGYKLQEKGQALITLWNRAVFEEMEADSLWKSRAMAVKLRHQSGAVIEFTNLHLKYDEKYSSEIFSRSLMNMKARVGTIMGGDNNRSVNEKLFVGMADWTHPTALEKTRTGQQLTTERSYGKLVACYDSFSMAPLDEHTPVHARYLPSYRFERLASPQFFGPGDQFELMHKSVYYTPTHDSTKMVAGLPWIRQMYRKGMTSLLNRCSTHLAQYTIEECFTYYKSSLPSECATLTRMFGGES